MLCDFLSFLGSGQGNAPEKVQGPKLGKSGEGVFVKFFGGPT